MHAWIFDGIFGAPALACDLTCLAYPMENKVFLLGNCSLVCGRAGLAHSGMSHSFMLLLDFTVEIQQLHELSKKNSGILCPERKL